MYPHRFRHAIPPDGSAAGPLAALAYHTDADTLLTHRARNETAPAAAHSCWRIAVTADHRDRGCSRIARAPRPARPARTASPAPRRLGGRARIPATPASPDWR